MTSAISETKPISALRKSSEPANPSDRPGRNQHYILNRIRLKRLLWTVCCMASSGYITTGQAQTQSLSPREIAVLDSVTCGFVQGEWIPGSISREGYFTPLQNQIAKEARQLKNAKARGATEAKVNRCIRRLKSLRKTQNVQMLTCRTIGTEPDNFGTPTYSPTPYGPTPVGTNAGVQAPDSPTATPRPTRTPTPVQTVAIKISLVDPCSNGPIAGFDPVADGASIDLQEVPANANVIADVAPESKSQVKSLKIRIGSNDPVIENSSGPAVAYKPNIDPVFFHQPIPGDIYPGKLPAGTYIIRAFAYSGLNARDEDLLGSSQIAVTVSDTDIASKSSLSFADYGYGPTTSNPRIYTPQETATGCIRTGVSDGAKVAVLDINQNASGFNVDLDAARNWNYGKVGIGYDGEIAVVSPFDSSKFNLGFYGYDRMWKFGGEVTNVPLELNLLSEPVITLQYLFVSGFGWGADYGGTSSFLIDLSHDGVHPEKPKPVTPALTVDRVDILAGPYPSEYFPDNYGGFFGIASYNGVCDPGDLFHIREAALISGANKRFADDTIGSDDAPCLLPIARGSSFVAEVANRELYIAAQAGAEDGTNPHFIIARYDRGLTFGGNGSLTLEAAPQKIMSASLPPRTGLRDIAVLDNGNIAVLFHDIDPKTVDYSASPLALTHTIAFYSNNGIFIGESTVALPFAASGMKAITGGKLVLYGPSNDAEQLTNGQAHIAIVY